MTVAVWVAGEGNNELGPNDGYGGRGRGVIEALLTRVRVDGWECIGKTQWSKIRKYRVGGAKGQHGDYWNVLRLVLDAIENKAAVAVFSRDIDSDPDREEAIADALTRIRDDSDWTIEVVGGVAKPAIEGWIVALHGERDTDEMSRPRAKQRLAELDIERKSNTDYVAVIDDAKLGAPPHFGLPPGTESLRSWLALAHDVLNRLVA